MIIKPFIKPVFTKLIERDDSFASTIFNKMLSAGYGNYGLSSLIYLRKPAEKYMEEDQDTKTEYNIELMYKMLMQLSTVKNNPNYISKNYIYYLTNIQNNISHYLKALSYMDKNIVLKSKVINDSLTIYGKLTNELKNYNEIFKNKNIVSHENSNFLRNINYFYYSKYNISNKSKTSMLNSRSEANINNEVLYANRNKVFNDNNIFNKYGYVLSENIKFANLSSKNNTTLNEQLFNEVNNYIYNKPYKNIANYKELNFLNNNLKSINAPYYSLGSNNRFDNIILKSLIKRDFYFNDLSYAQLFREIKNNSDIFKSSYKSLYINKFNELNEFFHNESSNVQNSQEKIIKLNRDANNNVHYYLHDNIWNTMKTSIKSRNVTFNIINSMLNRNLRFNTDIATINKEFFINKSLVSNSIFDSIILKNLIKKDFYFTNLSHAHQSNEIKNYADIFRSNLKNVYINKLNELNHSINMESSNIQNLQEKIIKLNRNSNDNILEKQIDNIAHSFNNYLYNKLYKNIDNYRSKNIASYEYVDFLNTSVLKTGNVFYYLQNNKKYGTKASIKNKNSTFNIINSMLNKSRNEILNRNFGFNTDNAWNSYNSKFINEEFFNSYDSFNEGILNKILCHKVLNKANINEGFFINKSLGNNNSFNNEILNKTFYLKVLNKADINKEFYINELLSSSKSFKNLIEKNLNNTFYGKSKADNNVFNKYHFNLNKNSRYLSLSNKKNALFYGQLSNEINNYKESFNDNFKNLYINKFNQFGDNASLIIKGLQEKIITQNWDLKNSIFRRKIDCIADKYNEFHKNSNKIINKNFINSYSILHNDNIQSKNYFNSFNLNKSETFTRLFYPELFTKNIFNKNSQSSSIKKNYFEKLFDNELLLLTNKSIGNTSFLFQKNFLPKYSPINIGRDYMVRLSLYNYKQNEFGNEVNSNYIVHNSDKSNTNNNEIYEESYSDKVKIKHKRVQTTVSKENSVIEDIETEHNTKYVTQQNLKRFVNEAVETIINDKLENINRVEYEEGKQVEIISNKVLAKIDRELKYEKRRRGII